MRRWLRHRLALPFMRKAAWHQEAAVWALAFYPADTTGYALGELRWALGGLYLSVAEIIAGDIDV